MLFLSISSLVLLISVAFVSYFVLSRIAVRLSADRQMIVGIHEGMDSSLPPFRRWFETAVEYLARLNRNLKLGGYVAWAERTIRSGGDPWRKDAYQVLAYSELILVFGYFAALLLMLGLFGTLNPIGAAVIAALAALMPQYLLASHATKRMFAISRKIPFALDLMVLCMEAGSSFLESIEIMVGSDPGNPLCQEFNQVLQSIRHGKTRHDALNEMAQRVKSDALTPIVQAINTGEELGTPIGKVLRLQADGLRLKRTQRAEKLAGEASSKILFPSLLIMVAVLLMLLGPVIVKAVTEGWL
ncbi:MAG: type II secretion system F family protein [Acidobacteria bacterium]|nr:MAG: type II secretion system F family protein [Acidobacteriota bacterium]